MRPSPPKTPKIAKAPMLPARSLFSAAPKRPKMKRAADPKIDAALKPTPAMKRGAK